MRIAIATVQVPFLQGGAEALTEGLKRAIQQAGHPVEVITIPFRFFPELEISRAITVWENEDYHSLNMVEPDLVICLKFPAFYLKHSRKRAWILHQFRGAYELYEPASANAISDYIRKKIIDLDTYHLGQCDQLFTISERVAYRLHRYNQLSAKSLYHPPPHAESFYTAPAKPYIFAPGRIETLKRQDMLIEAMRLVKSPVYAIIAGTGGQYGRLSELIIRHNLQDRVRLLGAISLSELQAFYANCLGVFFGPFDEDYGYISLEAMLSAKPVITCQDSGGPLEFVDHNVNGLVLKPAPEPLAAAIEQLYQRRAWATKLGRTGLDRYQSLNLSWEHVVANLLD